LQLWFFGKVLKSIKIALMMLQIPANSPALQPAKMPSNHHDKF
jgi:hypothetical protein